MFGQIRGAEIKTRLLGNREYRVRIADTSELVLKRSIGLQGLNEGIELLV